LTPKGDYVVDRDINCVEFAPDVFAHLRALDGYDLSDIQRSLEPTLPENIKKIFKAGEGMGKSGSFFFFSHDDKFLIKTMTTDDFAAFKKLFRAYFEHINQCPKSLLARIYGVYSVQMDDQNPVYLILMGNSKKCEDSHIKKCYDLKGSMVNRHVKGEDENTPGTSVLKDKNLLDLRKKEKAMLFDPHDQEDIMHQMGLDISLLQQFGLMDYSLLFVIEYNPNYIKMFPSDYRHDDGNLRLPVQPTAKVVKKLRDHTIDFKNQKRKKEVSRAFLQKMAGQTDATIGEKLATLQEREEQGKPSTGR
jgi:hypothetical protein